MRRALVALAPLWVTPLLFALVLRSGNHPSPWVRTVRPHEAYDASRCTWYCHNHGCDHGTVLPAVLSDDLFYGTVRWLHAFGNRLVPGASFAGYQAANLLVFCAVWPVGMYALYLLALRQRRKLRERRRP